MDRGVIRHHFALVGGSTRGERRKEPALAKTLTIGEEELPDDFAFRGDFSHFSARPEVDQRIAIVQSLSLIHI